jgi:isopropylmalate/homocitrate/citramalate synthase
MKSSLRMTAWKVFSAACQAIKLARAPGQLAEASRLMEDAFSRYPPLRADYEYLMQLWKKGVAM